MKNKQDARHRRGRKTTLRIKSALERARIAVFRSNTHIYAQIVSVNEKGDKVLASSSTVDKELKADLLGKNKVEQAAMVGKLLGKRALENGITQVAFDRAGYKYHGRVKALAEGAREAGLDF